jgi:N-dimethylarginine dimethylaminohydrolase
MTFQSEIKPVKNMILKHARDAFVDDETIDRQWRDLNYAARPHLTRAIQEYEAFVQLLSEFQIELHFLPREDSTGLDSIYVRDASLVCKEGAILCSMGKAERSTEPAAQASFYESLGIPTHGQIGGQGMIEGGDTLWIDEQTIVVGRGYRTNNEGIRQLRNLIGNVIQEIIVVPLPHWKGPGDVFHLMSIISPIDADLALVYSPLMPVPFREKLLTRGIQLIEVPEEEFETLGGNVLAVGPRKCVMVEGNRESRRSLERVGAEVHVFKGEEICFKGAGGPTCLTRPLWRE